MDNRVEAQPLECQQCGHRWFPTKTRNPRRCVNPKCRSMRWRKTAQQSPPPGKGPKPIKIPRRDPVIAMKPAQSVRPREGERPRARGVAA